MRFLCGIAKTGWGKWHQIAHNYVKSRDRIQVASHAYKYLKRIKQQEEKRKRDEESLKKIQISALLN